MIVYRSGALFADVQAWLRAFQEALRIPREAPPDELGSPTAGTDAEEPDGMRSLRWSVLMYRPRARPGGTGVARDGAARPGIAP